MKEKKLARFFSIVAYEKEQTFLRQQHQQGWKLKAVKGIGMYHFEQCEPEDVVYQLDYYAQKSANSKAEYIQLFEDCGWEYIQDLMGYSYFRKPASHMNGTEEIFCDDESRFDMIKRVFIGRMIPLIVIFFCIVVPNLLFHHSMGSFVLDIMFIVLSMIYLVIFVVFGFQYYQFYKRMHGMK